MSAVPKQGKRIGVPDLAARKGGVPIVALTAYTAPMARLLDAEADLLLVGDSLGMVIYGMPDTLSVTMDMMIAHGRAVVANSERALVAIDMPFGSFEESPEQAFRNCARMMSETGAQAVKFEGGEVMAETIRFLTARGIPVLAHVGLLPQQSRAHGGFKVRGKDPETAAAAVRDAEAVAEAGAFAVVVEGLVEPVARDLTARVDIPTIGIGASAACDGQILVCDDMLGLTQMFTPRFVHRYADLSDTVRTAAKNYAEDVRARAFPGPEHVYHGTKAAGETD